MATNEPEATIWATATDLAGTNQERKQYFVVVEDGNRRLEVILVAGPGKAISVEPYVHHEYNYTVHDACNHEDDYCVLEDPGTWEYEAERIEEAYRWKFPPKEPNPA